MGRLAIAIIFAASTCWMGVSKNADDKDKAAGSSWTDHGSLCQLHCRGTDPTTPQELQQCMAKAQHSCGLTARLVANHIQPLAHALVRLASGLFVCLAHVRAQVLVQSECSMVWMCTGGHIQKCPESGMYPRRWDPLHAIATANIGHSKLSKLHKQVAGKGPC